MSAPSLREIRKLPKVDLHLHLDGAIRVETIWALGRKLGVRFPATSSAGLAPHVTVGKKCRDLSEFLRKFEPVYPILPHTESLFRISVELCEDQARDGVIYFETRYAPVLSTRKGFTQEDSIRTVLAGLREGERRFGVRWGLILCLYRGARSESSVKTVRLALKYRRHGVVGIDLAGDEKRFPPDPHKEAFALAHRRDLPITFHVGEAGSAADIREAVERYGARRIGHGVALARDPILGRSLARQGVALECCLTSNIQTGSVSTIGKHPFSLFRSWGIPTTLNTDDPGVSRIRLSGELHRAARAWRLNREDVLELQRTAVRSSFAPPRTRRELLRRIR